MARKLDSADTAKELCDRLKRLRPDTERRWGKMTPHQMVCHLVDCFRVVSGEREVSTSINLVNRTVMRWGALHTPLRWPRGVPTRPEIDQEAAGTPPAEWESDFEELMRWLQEFPAKSRFVPHPMMGTLSVKEWRTWGYRHVDHHFRQFGI